METETVFNDINPVKDTFAHDLLSLTLYVKLGVNLEGRVEFEVGYVSIPLQNYFEQLEEK